MMCGQDILMSQPMVENDWAVPLTSFAEDGAREECLPSQHSLASSTGNPARKTQRGRSTRYLIQIDKNRPKSTLLGRCMLMRSFPSCTLYRSRIFVTRCTSSRPLFAKPFRTVFHEITPAHKKAFYERCWELPRIFCTPTLQPDYFPLVICVDSTLHIDTNALVCFASNPSTTRTRCRTLHCATTNTGGTCSAVKENCAKSIPIHSSGQV